LKNALRMVPRGGIEPPTQGFSVLELEQIKYNHLQDSRTPSLQRKFWVKRTSLIEKQIEDYLNTYDAKENS
jgi:hypothetical protein